MDANEIGTVWRAIDFAVRERYSKGFFWITSSFLCVCVCGKMMMTHLVNKGHRPSLFLFFFFLFRCKVGHDIINRDQHHYSKKMSNRMRSISSLTGFILFSPFLYILFENGIFIWKQCHAIVISRLLLLLLLCQWRNERLSRPDSFQLVPFYI